MNEFLNGAEAVAQKIIEEGITSKSGAITWGRGADRQKRPIPDSGPFNGRCGEALFFAALFRATGKQLYKNTAIEALLGLERNIDDEAFTDDLLSRLSFGLNGTGGLIYALALTGAFLRDHKYIRMAARLASRVSAEAVEHDQKLDVIWGAAGLLLGCLKLERMSSGCGINPARLCAQHLLRMLNVNPETGLRAWTTAGKDPWTGLSHGNSGIAHSLLGMHKMTGEDEYYLAAIDAIGFERSLFDDVRKNWRRAVSTHASGRIQCSWCHGATGIGFVRLGALDVLKDEDEADIAADLVAAIERTLLESLVGPDSICCGNFGRFDFILEAGHRLGDETLSESATTAALCRLESGLAETFNVTPNTVNPHLGPGFWQGFAGVGYSLLRHYDRGTFPCVLLLE